MSYTALGFGALLPQADPRNCGGNVAAEANTPDEGNCCPMDEWTNAVYGQVTGAVSLRHWKEERVRSIVGALVAPSPPDPTYLHKLAYDLGVAGSAAGSTATAALAQRLRRAWTNFNKLYPSDRWGPSPEASATSTAKAYAPCGPFPRWTIVKTDPWTLDRLSVLSSVVGETIPALPPQDLFSALIAVAKGTPPPWMQSLITWIQKANTVIDRVVPPSLRVGTKYHGQLPKNVTTSYGMLAPSPWLKQFMDVFAGTPQPQISPAVLGQKLALAPQPQISPAVLGQKLVLAPITPKGAEEPALPRPEEPTGIGTWLLIGGVVALAAGGYYFYMKKKRAPKSATA